MTTAAFGAPCSAMWRENPISRPVLLTAARSRRSIMNGAQAVADSPGIRATAERANIQTRTLRRYALRRPGRRSHERYPRQIRAADFVVELRDLRQLDAAPASHS
jgi:hypothetical protein